MVKALSALLALVLAVFMWWTGWIELITDMDWVRAQVDAAGWLGPVLFMFMMLALFPLFAAGPLVWMSAAIWSVPTAILFSSLGSVLCGWFFFALARGHGQNWAEGKIPEKVLRYEKKLEARPWRTIIILRALLWINPAVDAFIGLSHVSTRTYLLASTAALVPLTSLHVLAVAYGLELLFELPIWSWFLAGCALALCLVCWAGLHWRKTTERKKNFCAGADKCPANKSAVIGKHDQGII